MGQEETPPGNGPALPPPVDGSAESEILNSSAVDLAEAVRGGRFDATEVVQASLDRIAAVDDAVQAWAHLDPGRAREQAEAADQARREGKPMGRLSGVPVGVKDIFDTRDFPTEDGTVLHAGRRPEADATAVARLRAAGAVILGKTVTTELAVYSPGKTRNPHDPTRTPGGSSSGSAAAVASYMAPICLGTQTNGSTIRPAAYCGVYGFKPSHGLISRHRILQQSRPLDQVGVFARCVEDLALAFDALAGYDEQDPDTRPVAAPDCLRTAMEEPPVPPQIAFVKTPVWDQAESTTHEAFEELVEHLGDAVEEVSLTSQFDDAVAVHRTIMEADLARSFEQEYARGKDRLSAVLREMIERGQKVAAVDYNNAVGRIGLLRQVLDAVFHKFDAIVTPATTGEAPVGLESTGSPVFCTLWTLCGVPAATLPLMSGPAGLPLGVQLVGPRGDDARLLRTARWLTQAVLNDA
ncbi:MAG: amidase [Gammaproteobacteria bacterium]|nr:amidase [Gammaproteobacteria bacterium]